MLPSCVMFPPAYCAHWSQSAGDALYSILSTCCPTLAFKLLSASLLLGMCGQGSIQMFGGGHEPVYNASDQRYSDTQSLHFLSSKPLMYASTKFTLTSWDHSLPREATPISSPALIGSQVGLRPFQSLTLLQRQ